jgi:hypothetical protein
VGYCSRRNLNTFRALANTSRIWQHMDARIQHGISCVTEKALPSKPLLSLGCLMCVFRNVLQAKKVMGKVAEVGPLPKKV